MNRAAAIGFLLLGLSAGFVDAKDLARTPPPSWVVTQAWEPPAPDTNSHPDADYQDLFRDYQENVATHELYAHFAFRLLTSRAVQDDSTLRIDYAPDYQTVRLHTLTIWRDGKPTSQKSLAFRSLQRETRLEESMYDGGETWVGFIRDVRPGDVLEVGFTTQGDNPIFGGRYADSFHLETGYPLGRWSLRILAPRGRSPEIRAFGTDHLPQTKLVGGLEETSVEVDSVPAVFQEDNAPSDSIRGGRYVISDWRTWADVVRWAQPAYEAKTPPEVTALALSLTAGSATSEEKALALLQYVQDNIRYLGIEAGVNSHQPRPAAEVLENGFGDCKDKAVLFCSLSAAVGLSAWSVLVDTRDGDLVRTNGPTPLAFNHVIAAVEIDGNPVFVDPTLDHQGGPLATRALGSYQYGLELKDGTTDLTPLEGPTAGRRELVQTFHFPSFTDEATVTMDYTFTGSDADDQRRYWDGLDPAQWRKSIDEWLHDRYGDAQVDGDPQRDDDRSADEFRLKYQFKLRGYWKKDNRQYEADFYPSLIGEGLYDPEKVAARSQPYRLEHPETLRQVRRIELPDRWNIAPVDRVLSSPGFDLSISAKMTASNVIELVEEFKSRDDRVSPSDWTSYLETLREARTQVTWSLTHDAEDSRPSTASSVPPQSLPASPEFARVTAVLTSVLLFFLLASFQGSDF